jgi:hypothetical protein
MNAMPLYCCTTAAAVPHLGGGWDGSSRPADSHNPYAEQCETGGFEVRWPLRARGSTSTTGIYGGHATSMFIILRIERFSASRSPGFSNMLVGK